MNNAAGGHSVASANTSARPQSRAAARLRLLAPGLIVLATVAAYWNSFQGVFLFDDQLAIIDNVTIRRLMPPWAALDPPKQTTVAGRPIVNLSLGVNYAIGADSPVGYHVVNLAIHVACALLLYALVGRLLASARLKAKYGAIAIPAAFAIALLWALHPLQTMSVTYVVQRAEALMALFYLLTVYGLLHADTGRWPGLWYSVSVAACALGMGCKESMVTAPLTVLLVDGILLSPSFMGALRRRAVFYGGLAATWLILAVLMAPAPRSESAGLGFQNITPLEYLRTQPGVILHYLRLVFWPQPLCLDYEWPIVRSWGEILPAALVVIGLLALAVWSIVRRRPWGLVLALFFLLLSPTSSFVPISIVASEHRMYLPLAVVLTLVVMAAAECARKVGAALPRAAWVLPCVGVVVAAVALGCATYRRNNDYHSASGIWRATLAQCPSNARAHNNYGSALEGEGRLEDADWHLHEAIRLSPAYADAHYNLGVVRARRGDIAGAHEAFVEAIRLRPNDAPSRYNLGRSLELTGKLTEAIAAYREAVKLNPVYERARTRLGFALATTGQCEQAVAEFRQLVQSDAPTAEVLNALAWIEATHPDAKLRNGSEAVRLAERADALVKHGDAAVLDTLAAAYAEVGRFDDALATAERAKTLADEVHDPSLGRAIEARMVLYRQMQPYREVGPSGG